MGISNESETNKSTGAWGSFIGIVLSFERGESGGLLEVVGQLPAGVRARGGGLSRVVGQLPTVRER